VDSPWDLAQVGPPRGSGGQSTCGLRDRARSPACGSLAESPVSGNLNSTGSPTTPRRGHRPPGLSIHLTRPGESGHSSEDTHPAGQQKTRTGQQPWSFPSTRHGRPYRNLPLPSLGRRPDPTDLASVGERDLWLTPRLRRTRAPSPAKQPPVNRALVAAGEGWGEGKMAAWVHSGRRFQHAPLNPLTRPTGRRTTGFQPVGPRAHRPVESPRAVSRTRLSTT
jgi:hypothetical protein